MKKILLSVMALGMISTMANAACNASGCNDVVITKLYALNNGDVYISTTGTQANLNCGYHAIRLPKDHAGQKVIYSALLTAKTTKQKVGIQIITGSAKCDMAYMSL